MSTTPGPHAAGRLYDGAVPVATLITRVHRHWDRIGPTTHPCHVNPMNRTEWIIRFDDPDRACIFSDEVDLVTPAHEQWATGTFTVNGQPLRVEWLAEESSDAACAREGW